MVDPELSRREILAGMAVTGTSGALVGSGTVSLFSDEETFTNNQLRASGTIAGIVELSVNISQTDKGIVFEITLPKNGSGVKINNTEDGEGETINNPAHVWVRSVACPKGQANPEVTLQISCDDDSNEIISGSLLDVLTSEKIRTGTLLSCPSDDSDCLRPGETRELELVLEEEPTGSTSFELKFYAQQCRYNTAPEIENPFSETGPESCCIPCPAADGKRLVKYEWHDDEEKFTTEGSDENIQEVDERRKVNEDGDLTEACFTTDYCLEDNGIDVIVKGSTECEKVTYSEHDFCVNNGVLSDNPSGSPPGISHISFYCEGTIDDETSCTKGANGGGGR